MQPEQDKILHLLQRTFELSAHILSQDTTQLPSQLWGRLLSFKRYDAIHDLLRKAKQYQNQIQPWLCPIVPNFTPPGGALIRTLSEHEDELTAVAITPDGSKIVSASLDKTIKVWDLYTGFEVTTFMGETSFYSCAVGQHPAKIVAGDLFGVVHFFRLEGLTIEANNPNKICKRVKKR